MSAGEFKVNLHAVKWGAIPKPSRVRFPTMNSMQLRHREETDAFSCTRIASVSTRSFFDALMHTQIATAATEMLVGHDNICGNKYV